MWAGLAVELTLHRGKRQVNGERGSVPFPEALDPYGSALQLDQMLDDGEPQAQASVSACRRGIRLPEALEHVRDELGFYADPGIGGADRCAS
jgi:hypothetical protein